MIEVQLFKFTKRLNSTLLPNGVGLGTTEVSLKQGTSVDTPTLIISMSTTGQVYALWTANYLKMRDEYYWITDIIQLTNNHVEIQCKKDVLATYRDNILNTTAFVKYSSSKGRLDLIDPRNVKTINQNYVFEDTYERDIFKVDTSGGTFIFEAFGNNAVSEIGPAVTILNPQNYSNVMSQLYGTDDFLREVSQYLAGPQNVIVKVLWYPFATSYLNDKISVGEELPLSVGTIQVTNENYKHIMRIDRKQMAEVQVIDLSNVIKDNYKFDESNCSISCYLPFYGMIDLPTNIIIKTGKMFKIRMTLDIYTGTLLYEILVNNLTAERLIATYKTSFGFEVPIAYSQKNTTQMIGSSAIAAGSLIAATAFAPAATAGLAIGASAIMGTGNLVNSVASLKANNGTVGSLNSTVDLAYANEIKIYVSQTELAEDIEAKRNVYGLPYAETVELSTLTGYVQCEHASVAAPAMESEIQEINNFLNGGVYLE